MLESREKESQPSSLAAYIRVCCLSLAVGQDQDLVFVVRVLPASINMYSENYPQGFRIDLNTLLPFGLDGHRKCQVSRESLQFSVLSCLPVLHFMLF